MKRSPDARDGDIPLPIRQDQYPTNAEAVEREIDQILADSFPASDPPPWTLGVTHAAAKDDHNRKRYRGNRS